MWALFAAGYLAAAASIDLKRWYGEEVLADALCSKRPLMGNVCKKLIFSERTSCKNFCRKGLPTATKNQSLTSHFVRS
jgi:hypothetical protein